ncbi:hypothetical protein [Paenibacillus sp. FSL W8-0194]|uniref:hypothetical protein n=1 Tax=Paenibacillus sp. FSL W8-0194 TaxID=2921711 RepID=UPI0030D9BC16
MPFSGEAFSRNLSLWAARAGSHVFDQSQMLNYGYNQITDRNKCQALDFRLLPKKKHRSSSAMQSLRHICVTYLTLSNDFYKAEEA